MRFLCRNPKHIDKRVDFKCLKMHNKKKEDRIYITVRRQGVAQSPQAPVDACIKNVMNSGDRCYFLYLATWSIPMYVPQCETFMEKCNVGEEISAAGDRPALTAATIFCRTESGFLICGGFLKLGNSRNSKKFQRISYAYRRLLSSVPSSFFFFLKKPELY